MVRSATVSSPLLPRTIWTSRKDAARRTGLKEHMVKQLVEGRLVETLELPSGRVLVALSDVEQWLRQAHRPHRRPAPAD